MRPKIIEQTPPQFEPTPRIARNRCFCSKCGDLIESRSVHHYVTCSCGAISTDGGLEYYHRSGSDNLIDVADDDAKAERLMLEFASLKPRKS
jgi:hypothetical protein